VTASRNEAADSTRPGASAAARRARWGRPLAFATALVFLISSPFPIAACLVPDTTSFPVWWGAVDVGIAFALAALAFAVVALAGTSPGRPVESATYRIYRAQIHALIVGMVVFFLAGDRIIWANCLTGFVWRGWLLLYTLPAWLAASGLVTRANQPHSDRIDESSL
jgi:hypothetical protein